MQEVTSFTPSVLDQSWVTDAETDTSDDIMLIPIDGLQKAFDGATSKIIDCDNTFIFFFILIPI